MPSSQTKLPLTVFLLINTAKHPSVLAVPGAAVMTMLCATKAVPGGADWSVTEQNVPEQQLVARKLGAHTPELPLGIFALLTMERLSSDLPWRFLWLVWCFSVFLTIYSHSNTVKGESPEIYISWAGSKIPTSTMMPESSWLCCIGKVAQQSNKKWYRRHTSPHVPQTGSSVILCALHKRLHGLSEGSL